MADLGLMDIVALAKAGYKMRDIEALKKSEQEKPAELLNPEADKKEGIDSKEDPAPSEKKENSEGDDKTDPEDSKDYKSLYDDLQKENEKALNQIKQLQAKINSSDRSGSEGKDTTMDDLLSSFKNFS